MQQLAHVLPGDGAALQRRLQPISYEHKQQLGAVQLPHTLHSLLLGQEGDISNEGLVQNFILKSCKKDPVYCWVFLTQH